MNAPHDPTSVGAATAQKAHFSEPIRLRGGAELPAFEVREARRGARATGKAILFARTGVTLGDTRAWLDDALVRDVPHPGERIAAGHPVCTVFAEAADAAGCYAALVARAARIYAAMVG